MTARAKDLVLRPIPRADAVDLVRRVHYSGKVVNNSQLHIGVFLHNNLEGAMQFGPPLDKSKALGLVRGTPWDGMLELNRMAFTEALPPHSESRAIAVSLRLIRRHAPRVKWVLSYSDATQCGDGTIYRAAGFILTGIKRSDSLARMPDGSVVHRLSLATAPEAPRPEAGGRSFFEVTDGAYSFESYVREVGGTILPGFQLRYLAFVDPTWRDRLAVEPLPYSAIDAAGARMYRGARPD
ncbi:hypothetical protein [Kitasatospora sp. NPDC002965]|uniref:Mom family adenine methylcarbamoylation protein n=1 Tax=Kitasatospora sp. NPDC002965 TaxID=3154775 RepID=UPI0033AEDFE2